METYRKAKHNRREPHKIERKKDREKNAEKREEDKKRKKCVCVNTKTIHAAKSRQAARLKRTEREKNVLFIY